MAKKNKSEVAKPPAKKSVKTKSASPATGKNKQEKRASTASVPADLHLPKDPEPPSPMIVDQDTPEALRKKLQGFVFETELNLWFLRKLANEVDDTAMQGNDRFRRISDAYADRWTEAPKSFDDDIKMTSGLTTVEEAVEVLYDMVKKDSSKLMLVLMRFLDPEQVKDDDDDEVWDLRQLCVGVAQQPPTSFFKYDEATSDGPSRADQFWNTSNPKNPILDSEYLMVNFWAAVSLILDHPWRANYHFYRNQGKKSVLDIPESSRKPGEHRNTLTNWLNSTSLSGSMRSHSPATVNSSSSNPGLDEKFEDLAVEPSKRSKKKLKSTSVATEKVSRKKELRFDMESQELPHKRRDSENAALIDSLHHDEDQSNQSSVNSKDMSNLEDEETMAVDDSSDEDSVPASDNDQPIQSVKGTKQDLDKVGKATSSKSYSEAAQSVTVEPDDIPLAERIQNLRQVNLEGLDCQVHFFQPVFSMMWNGSTGGKKSVSDAWVKNIVEALSECLQNSNMGFRILPVSDTDYKNRRYLIRNEAELRSKIRNIKHLRRYIDMEFGNAGWASVNGKTGEKQLRTRMRIGFDLEQQPDAVMKYVNDSLRSSMGNRAGCFRSPVQFGNQVRIGLLAFYPGELDFGNIERQLMEKLEFKIPLGLQWEWVAMPYDGRTKWNDRQPGIRLWHIYCPRDQAAHVDRILRQWLNPNTAKKDFPWAAVTHYISDWKATEAGLASVRSCGLVKDTLVTMVSKARDFQDLTTVIYSDSELPGMLKQVQTTKFGKSSLLKMLLSIKATPAQAAAADGAKDDDSGEEDDDVQVAEEGTDFVKVARKSKQKGLREAMEASTAGMTPAQIQAEQAKEFKRQADQKNCAPSPLFLMILPGEMVGTYVFVSRLKFETLAKNVIQGLVPFLLYHLEEPDPKKANKMLSRWISKSAIHRAERRNLVWNPETLSVSEANTSTAGVDDGLDFLEFGMDILDSFQGSLSIDMEMAEAKDIDDGATVAGALADLLDSQSQLKDARHRVQIQQIALDESKAQLTVTTNALQDSVDALDETEQALKESEKRRQQLEQRIEQMTNQSKPGSLSATEQRLLELAAKVEALEQEKIAWEMAKQEGLAKLEAASSKQISPPRSTSSSVASPQILSPPEMRASSPGEHSSVVSTPSAPSFAPYPPPPPKPTSATGSQSNSSQPLSVTPMGDNGSRGAAPSSTEGP